MNSLPPDLRLDWCTHAAAKFAVERWHYSRSLPAPPYSRVGVWEGGKFVGVVIFSRGANGAIGKPYNCSVTEVCELTRIALISGHKVPVSRVLRVALLFLRRQSPGLRLVVSYADPFEGHHGGVYQASGWIYSGRTKTDWAVIDIAGRRHHSRVASETGIKVQFGRRKMVIKPSDGKRIELPGKHRYLMPLDDEIRARVLPLAQPYPKRAKQATAEHPSASGGAAPTGALQSSMA